MKNIKKLMIVLCMFFLCACSTLNSYRMLHTAKEYKGKNVENIYEELEEAGFTNISKKAVYDLKSDQKSRVGEISSVTFDGSNEYVEGDFIPLDSKVVITYHDMVKHNVKVHVNFESNWFFYKYDVVMIVDKEHKETLPHGETKDFSMDLKEGEYTIKFRSADDKNVQGEQYLTVLTDMEVSYTIHCEGDRVEVMEDYQQNGQNLKEDEIQMTSDVYSFVNMNYEDVFDLLTNVGFKNISTEPVYDIRFGITVEKTVADVTIDGTDLFEAGTIFKNTDPVVIYYHMKEEDAPDNQTQPTKELEYDYAFKHNFGDYDLYYLFDKETYTVTLYKSDEKSITQGTYVGKFKEGVEMIFNINGNVIKETFIYKDKKASLVDAYNYTYEFEKVDVKEAQKLMDRSHE